MPFAADDLAAVGAGLFQRAGGPFTFVLPVRSNALDQGASFGERIAFRGESFPGARRLADELVTLPPAIVLDVGRLATGGWAVVEGNPAWASGLCGCDPAAVLSVLAAATVPRCSGGRWARDAVWTAEARKA